MKGTKRQELVTQELLKTIEANPQGFTASLDGKPESLNSGYAVSVTNNFGSSPSEVVRTALSLLGNLGKVYKRLHFGGWKDTQSGLFYLDLSLILESRDTAELLGKMHNQKAIFNFAEMQEIRL